MCAFLSRLLLECLLLPPWNLGRLAFGLLLTCCWRLFDEKSGNPGGSLHQCRFNLCSLVVMTFRLTKQQRNFVSKLELHPCKVTLMHTEIAAIGLISVSHNNNNNNNNNNMYSAVVTESLSRYSFVGINDETSCLTISPRTSRDSDEYLGYSGRLFQTAGPEKTKSTSQFDNFYIWHLSAEDII